MVGLKIGRPVIASYGIDNVKKSLLFVAVIEKLKKRDACWFYGWILVYKASELLCPLCSKARRTHDIPLITANYACNWKSRLWICDKVFFWFVMFCFFDIVPTCSSQYFTLLLRDFPVVSQRVCLSCLDEQTGYRETSAISRSILRIKGSY